MDNVFNSCQVASPTYSEWSHSFLTAIYLPVWSHDISMNLKYPFPKRRFLTLNCLLSLLACCDCISIQWFTLSKLCKHLIIFCFCIFLLSSSFIFHPEYEIVSPFEVNHEGVYISHEVAHNQRRRRRRSLTGSSETDGGSETLHFRLSGLGQDFHMELREASESLIAPGFTVQVLGKNGTKSLRAYHRDDLCFYQGSLRSKVNSSVALSTCTGMVSLNMHESSCGRIWMGRGESVSLMWAGKKTPGSVHLKGFLFKIIFLQHLNWSTKWAL